MNQGIPDRPVARQGQGPDQRANWPLVSVVVPCRNEETSIAACIESVFRNGYPGQLEVIVVDGMSTDRTREVLRRLGSRFPNLVVVSNQARITPVAINKGIEMAKGEVILLLGAHTHLGKCYVKRAVEHLKSNSGLGCVGGVTVPIKRGRITARAIGHILQSPFGVGAAKYRVGSPKPCMVDTVAYGVYRKEVFSEVGLFDERLVRNQDIEFNARLRQAGYGILLDPTIEAYYEPRQSLLSLASQNYRNGVWNSYMLLQGWHRSLAWRHFVPGAFALANIVLGGGSYCLVFARYAWLGLWVVYLSLAFVETLRFISSTRDYRLIWALVVFPVLHISYGVGTLVGLLRAGRQLRREEQGG